MQYYGTRLSENISRREPEGYLLCLNVPVARTGIQEYLPEELGLAECPAPATGTLPGVISTKGPPGPRGEISPRLIPVYRPPEEVFAPETVSSFEGMPVTNDHPPDGVDAENIRRLQAGHAHNVRRGTGAESDLLLADLIITDPCLIDAVLAGKREISCGYTYDLCEENGRYVQRKIRGNHIAVVDAGRAGARVSIRDRKPSACHPARSGGSSSVSHTSNIERSKNTMKKSITRALARLAKDGDAETVAEFIEEMIGETPEAPAEEAVTVEVPENHEVTIDSEFCASLLQRLDSLLALLSEGLAPASPATDEDPEEEIAEIVEEVLEAAQPEGTPEAPAEQVAEILEEVLGPEASVTLEEAGGDECNEQDPALAKDALRAALRVCRPVLKRMTPRERNRACADIAASLRGNRRAGDGKVYAALASARKPAPDLSALGKRIMASRNVNYKKG